MEKQLDGYTHLIERIIAAAQRQYAQLSGGQPASEYVRAMEQALCDENLTFTEPEPGAFIVEAAALALVGKSVKELRQIMAQLGLAAGVWLGFDHDTLQAERALPAWQGYPLFPEASVLIAVMTHPADLETAQNEGWYRIPSRSAPKFFPPDYVAFYFTQAFKEQAFSIHYFAPVRGHELLTRRDLLPAEPDHPRANQQYYKLQLGPLVKREPPIISKTWRRITFILTNGRRFSNASEINELILGPKEHDILWRALKERKLHAERCYVIRDERGVYRVDLAVLCRTGAVGIVCGEKPAPKRSKQPGIPLLHFTPEQVVTSLSSCLEKISTEVTRLGGAINNE